MKRIFWLLPILVIAIVFNGCKKDNYEDVPYTITTKALPKKPLMATKEKIVEVPAGLTAAAANNTYASAAVTWVNLANSFTSYASLFTPITDASSTKSLSLKSTKSTKDETYTWGYAGYMYTWTYAVTADKYTWTIKLNDQVYLYAEEAIDGKSGKMIWYDLYSTGSGNYIWEWHYDSANVFYYTLSYTGLKLDIVVYTDGSGKVDYYTGDPLVLNAKYVWAADGSGSYTDVVNNLTYTWTAN